MIKLIREGTNDFMGPDEAAKHYYDHGCYALWPDSIIEELEELGYDKKFIDEVFFIMNEMLDEEHSREEYMADLDYYNDDFEELFDESKNRRVRGRRRVNESKSSDWYFRVSKKLQSLFKKAGYSMNKNKDVYNLIASVDSDNSPADTSLSIDDAAKKLFDDFMKKQKKESYRRNRRRG